jgi:SCP-2 sterol transfer family
MPSARELIAVAVRNFEREVPALAKLKLVLRLELRGRGDIQVFRVRVPGPEVTKGEPEDARLKLSLPRASFNQLAEKGRLADWREAYEHGQIKVSGDREIERLLGTVIQRQEARSRLKKAH